MALYISEEIVIDILFRLPVKSLLRCRAVSRAWRDLIDNPKFIEQQNFRSASLWGRNGTGPILFQRADLETQRIYLTLLDSDTLGVAQEVKIPNSIPCSFNDVSYFWSLIGSCNGLVAINIFPVVVFQFDKNVDRVVISNPATRQFRDLPTPNCVKRQLIDYGFGYLSSTKDYKVVRIISIGGSCGRVNAMNEDSYIKVEVYSMKSDTWRKYAATSICPSITHSMRFMSHVAGIAVNEALHWPILFPPTGPGFRYSRGSIISFDIVHEVFAELKMPGPFMVPFNSKLRILELNGFLAVAAITTRESISIDLWVMREYGNSKSWSKVMSFDGPDIDFEDISFLGSWIDDKVIVLGSKKSEDMNQMILFEPSSRTSIKKVDFNSNWDMYQGCNYYETLTPVRSYCCDRG